VEESWRFDGKGRRKYLSNFFSGLLGEFLGEVERVAACYVWNGLFCEAEEILGFIQNFAGEQRSPYKNPDYSKVRAVFDVNVDGATSTIAIIILDSENREQDVKNLKKWFTVAAVPADKKLSLFNTEADFYRYLGESLSYNFMDMAASAFSAISK